MFGIPLFDLAWLVVALLAAGAITGLLAGVFDSGGGAVAVPILYELFRILEVLEDVRMPLCVGTSLAIIIPSSIRSFNAHQAKGAVDMSAHGWRTGSRSAASRSPSASSSSSSAPNSPQA